jgi:uncharacterized protein
MKKLIITSGTGFLGKVLIDYFKAKYDEIIILSRSEAHTVSNVKYLKWDGKTIGDWSNEFRDVTHVINLTGKSVDCRYNEENKKEIIASRINATNVIAQAINLHVHKPKVWMNAASATIYDASFDVPQTEKKGVIGDDFSMNVCKEWEKCFFSHTNSAEKMIAMRISIVFGKQGGVLPVLKKLTKLGLGGKQASGKQMVSWIHAHDYARMTEWLLNKTDAEAIYNCCSPKPVTNAELMKLLRAHCGKGFGLSQPEWLIKLGAIFLRTESELVMKSRYVIPEKALQQGFTFEKPFMQDALD